MPPAAAPPAAAAAAAAPEPAPFEGPEKRLDVEFRAAGGEEEGAGGPADLRALPRADVDALLTAAACTVLSVTATDGGDAYLLSESSLFIFARRLVIKTCGTTTLLAALPLLLARAAAVGLQPRHVQYSRGAFLFPAAQPAPHDDWAAEARLLDRVLGPAAAGAAVRVGGDKAAWHLYVADVDAAGAGAAPPPRRQTLEVLMHGLDERAMRQYVGNSAPAETTRRTGVPRLLHPDTVVDAYDFAPCGYSMNGLVPGGNRPADRPPRPASAGETPAYYTIHISPEPGASYVSFETSLDTDALAPLVAAAVALFKPSRFSAAFVGTPDSAAAAARPGAPIDWHKLRKLLAPHFHIRGAPTWLHVTRHTVAAVAAFVAGPDLRLISDAAGLIGADTGSPVGGGSPTSAADDDDAAAADADSPKHVAVRRAVLDPATSPVVGPIAVAVGARIITVMPSAAALPRQLSDGSEVSSSDESSDSQLEEELAAAAEDSDDAAACRRPARPGPAAHAADVDENEVSREAIAAVVGESSGAPLDRPLFIVDLGVVERRIAAARRSLGPAVRLRYAVHCNTDAAILAVMNGLDVEFEAASLAEVDLLRGAGVEPARIAYVSPVLSRHTLAHLGPAGVRSVAVYGRTTPASHAWLFPLLADAGVAVEVRVAPRAAGDALATVAAAAAAGVAVDALGLDLAPDAGCLPASALREQLAAGLATVGEVLKTGAGAQLARGGVSVSLGEQYPGGRDATTSLFESCVGELLDDLPRVTVDAGRYIVGPAVALVTSVIGRRCRAGAAAPAYNYYLDDGVYGAFSAVLVEGGAGASPHVFRRGAGGAEAGAGAGAEAGAALHDATLFGPTCDALDRIWTGPLPEMQVGDAVAFGRMGGYAASAVSRFNGFAGDFDTRYVVSKPVKLF